MKSCCRAQQEGVASCEEYKKDGYGENKGMAAEDETVRRSETDARRRHRLTRRRALSRRGRGRGEGRKETGRPERTVQDRERGRLMLADPSLAPIQAPAFSPCDALVTL